MKNISFVLLLLVLIIPNSSYAMKISEIMYDPPGTDSGREWIEIYNDSSISVDLSDWKFLENSVNHGLKLISGDVVLQSGGYAVIADNDKNFLIDNPNFKGTLFDSAFSLANTGEFLALVDSSDGVVDQISYSESLGSKGDGNSLQLYEGVFISSPSTPGAENSNTSTNTQNSTNASSSAINISTHSSSKEVSNFKPKIDFEIGVGRDRLLSVKTPIKLEPEIDSRFKRNSIRFLWNFGDGNQTKGRKAEHYYKHPGSYNLVLNASHNGQNAISRAVINVFKPIVQFKILDEGLEFYNQTSHEINIGGWKVKSEDKLINYSFPQDTIISADNKIIFDKILFVKNEDLLDFSQMKLNLYFPNGDIIKQ